MKIGTKTIACNVYGKIDSTLKVLSDVTEAQIPSIEIASDSFKGAGVLGEIDMPSLAQVGSMVFSFNFRTDGADKAALSAPKVQEFEVRWVVDRFDSSNIKIGIEAHKVFIKGFPKKYDPGKVTPGESMDGSSEYEVFYFRHIIDGVEVLLIDKFNYVFKVNGTDYGKDILAAL